MQGRPEVLYVGPSYVEVELTGRCDLDCLFCYRSKLQGRARDRDPELFAKILSDMRSFNLPYTLCFGGSGEPLMHEGFFTALEAAVTEPLVRRVIVETSGLLADANYAQFVSGHGGEKIITIVNINGHDGETYRSLHGSDRFSAVHGNVANLKEVLSGRAGDSLYLQVMKINETEPFLDAYYDFWETTKIPIILQKQNTFLGLIDDRRYSDLSPLERVPCWHLQRDLIVLADGSVPFCRVDAACSVLRGKVAEKSIAQIWDEGRDAFVADYRGALASRPDCVACDEWYTFNF